VFFVVNWDFVRVIVELFYNPRVRAMIYKALSQEI